MRLALFDFDGTITDRDTFTPFVRFSVGPWEWRVGSVALAPAIIAYKTGRMSRKQIRERIIQRAYTGRSAADVTALAARYSEDRLPASITPRAQDRIHWHQAKGDLVVVVSASLRGYLEPWCKSHSIDLICNDLEASNGLLTGRFEGGDCSGAEKARRVKDNYDLSRFSEIYAYGDTEDDIELLALAHEPYYRWQRVARANGHTTRAPSEARFRVTDTGSLRLSDTGSLRA
jgi:phosphatidylglycerophosphatase C